MLLDDKLRTLEMLTELRSLSVRIYMDDFERGTRRQAICASFPLKKIKINQSFVRHLPDDPESVAIVRAIITMGSCLGMSTTVEGVETREQYDFSVAEGCNTIQGYLISKPLDKIRFAELFLQDHPTDSVVKCYGRSTLG